MKKIAFGCDHVGFILKHEIVAHLVERGVEVIDKGTWSSERTDYPHYASQVALAVAGGERRTSLPEFARSFVANLIPRNFRGSITTPTCWLLVHE